MEGYLAEIRMFAPPFSPKYWAYCQGQLLAIATNQALFSLLGTTYGGDGRTTFGLPDFRGRIGTGTGQMAGGSYYSLGEITGTENVALVSSQLPAHNHNVVTTALTGPVSVKAVSDDGTVDNPAGAFFASANGANIYNPNADSTTGAWPIAVTGTPTIATTGGNQPHENRMPYLAMNIIICLQGIFPSRN
jgi:microcystin-dependent protein